MRILFALLLPIFCSANKENICSICYNKMDAELNDTVKTQCGHDFHTECLAKWTNTYNKVRCPFCRDPLQHLDQNEKNSELRGGAYLGNLSKVQRMIAQGANVNSTDQYEMTALLLAATGESDQFVHPEVKTEIAEFLLKNGANIDARDFLDQTPLMKAAESGRTDIVNVLLRHGADIEEATRNTVIFDRQNINSRDWTALMWAAFNRRTDVVQLLLARHADPYLKPYFYDHDLEPEIKELIKSKIAKNNQLRSYALIGNLPKVQEIIAEGADVNSRGDYTSTALMLAAWDGKNDVAEELLKHGATVDARDDQNRTALMYAASASRTDTVKLLLERGADPHIEPARIRLYEPEIKELIENI